MKKIRMMVTQVRAWLRADDIDSELGAQLLVSVMRYGIIIVIGGTVIAWMMEIIWH